MDLKVERKEVGRREKKEGEKVRLHLLESKGDVDICTRGKG